MIRRSIPRIHQKEVQLTDRWVCRSFWSNGDHLDRDLWCFERELPASSCMYLIYTTRSSTLYKPAWIPRYHSQFKSFVHVITSRVPFFGRLGYYAVDAVIYRKQIINLMRQAKIFTRSAHDVTNCDFDASEIVRDILHVCGQRCRRAWVDFILVLWTFGNNPYPWRRWKYSKVFIPGQWSPFTWCFREGNGSAPIPYHA
jgi:hypothetical protein